MTVDLFYYDTKPRKNLWARIGFLPIYNWSSVVPAQHRVFCIVHSSDVRDGMSPPTGSRARYDNWRTFEEFLAQAKCKGQPCALLFVSGGGPAQGPLRVNVETYRDDPHIHFYKAPVDQSGADDGSKALVSAVERLIAAWEANSAPNWDMLYTKWDVLLCDYLSAAALCSTQEALLKRFVDKTWDAGPLIPARLERAAADLPLFGDDLRPLSSAQDMLRRIHAGHHIDGDFGAVIKVALSIIRNRP